MSSTPVPEKKKKQQQKLRKEKKSNYVEILSQDSTRSLSELCASTRCSVLDCFFAFILFCFSFFFLCFFNNFLGISWAATAAFLFSTHKYVFIYAKLFIYARDFDDWWMDGRDSLGTRIMNAYLICTSCSPSVERGVGGAVQVLLPSNNINDAHRIRQTNILIRIFLNGKYPDRLTPRIAHRTW